MVMPVHFTVRALVLVSIQFEEHITRREMPLTVDLNHIDCVPCVPVYLLYKILEQPFEVIFSTSVVIGSRQPCYVPSAGRLFRIQS